MVPHCGEGVTASHRGHAALGVPPPCGKDAATGPSRPSNTRRTSFWGGKCCLQASKTQRHHTRLPLTGKTLPLGLKGPAASSRPHSTAHVMLTTNATYSSPSRGGRCLQPKRSHGTKRASLLEEDAAAGHAGRATPFPFAWKALLCILPCGREVDDASQEGPPVSCTTASR